MTKHRLLAGCWLTAGSLMLSACGQQPNPAPQAGQEQAEGPNTAQTESEDEASRILVVIDQTEMPIEIGGLTFSFKRVPEGYALNEMRWEGEGKPIVATFEQAREAGADGGDGFYISGDGQYSGFLYPESRTGETGRIAFVFADEEGQELTWEKEITLR